MSRMPGVTSIGASSSRAVAAISVEIAVDEASVRDARDRPEVGEAQLQRDRARFEPGVPQPRRDAVGRGARSHGRARRARARRSRTSPRSRSTSLRARASPAGRRCCARAARGACRALRRARPRAPTPAARRRRPPCCTPSASSRCSVAGPTPHSRPIGSGCRNASSVPGATTMQAVGLREVARDLGQELRRRHADRRDEARLLEDPDARVAARSSGRRRAGGAHPRRRGTPRRATAARRAA